MPHNTHTAENDSSRSALRELLDQLAAQASLSDAEVLDLAYAELHDARRMRRRD